MICVTRQPARDKGHLWTHGNGTKAQRGFSRLCLGVQGLMALAMSPSSGTLTAGVDRMTGPRSESHVRAARGEAAGSAQTLHTGDYECCKHAYIALSSVTAYCRCLIAVLLACWRDGRWVGSMGRPVGLSDQTPIQPYMLVSRCLTAYRTCLALAELCCIKCAGIMLHTTVA